MADDTPTPGAPSGATDVLEREETHTDHGWNTVLFNDPVNLVEFVIDTLVKIGLTAEEAQAKTLEAHQLGRATVFTGSRDEATTKAVALRSARLTATVEAS